MYIEIGDSIGTSLQLGSNDRKTLDEIESILTYASFTSREGKHCIKTASRACAQKITDYLQTQSGYQKIFFSYINSHFSTYLAGIKNLVKPYIVVEKTNKKIERLEDKIIVNTEFASRCDFWNSVNFLPENIIDWRYFLRIAYYEKMQQSILKNIDFSLTPEQGSGGRTIDTYKFRCNEGKFILAILDSDCSYPNQPYIPKSNADQFNKLDPTIYPTGTNVILDVHEIENLFSSDIFLSNGNKNNANKFIGYNLPPEIRQFYDFKTGFAYNRLFKNSYMNKKIIDSGITIKLCRNLLECLKKNKNCSCVVVEGMGNDYLIKLFGCNINETKKDISNAVKSDFENRLMGAPEDLIDPIKKEWQRIYRAFLTWFCSFKVNICVS